MQRANHFVSYMYSYLFNKKQNNVGFAKVDNRGEYFSIEVQVRETMRTEKNYKEERLFLLAERQEGCIGIPIGELLYENGVGKYKGKLLSQNIVRSGVPFEEIIGVYAMSGERCYASLWQEKEVDLRKIPILEDDKVSKQKIMHSGIESPIQAAEIKSEQAPFSWGREWERLNQISEDDELIFGLALWTRNKGKS